MRVCKVCNSPNRAQIEDELARRVPAREIGERYKLSLDVVWRHSKHLGRSIILQPGSSLLDRVEALIQRLETVSQKAASAQAWSSTVACCREIRECLELLSRLTGQYPSANQGVTVGVAVNVAQSASRNGVSDYDLDLQIAASVADATNNFNPATIAKLQRFLERNRTSDGRLLELKNAAS